MGIEMPSWNSPLGPRRRYARSSVGGARSDYGKALPAWLEFLPVAARPDALRALAATGDPEKLALAALMALRLPDSSESGGLEEEVRLEWISEVIERTREAWEPSSSDSHPGAGLALTVYRRDLNGTAKVLEAASKAFRLKHVSRAVGTQGAQPAFAVSPDAVPAAESDVAEGSRRREYLEALARAGAAPG